jgi:molybdopterin/thiamine biosynthesis adenylyltransferase
MHVTVPFDLLEAPVVEATERGETVVGVLTGVVVDESVVQAWGLREGRTTPDLADTVTRLGDRLGTASSADVEPPETPLPLDGQSAFQPPTVSPEPVGLLVVSTRDPVDPPAGIPTVVVTPASDSPEREGDATVPVDGTTWRLTTAAEADDDGVAVVHAHRDAQKRIDGLIDTEALADAHVTVVGLGTVGSTVAVELAKAGVGTFTLVDHDRLEIHNVARHVCGVDDLGRRKTRAVADRVRLTNPLASVETWDGDVTEAPQAFAGRAAESDLVVVCTDTDVSKLVVNRECLDIDVPAIYAGVYERAMGGDVIRVVPGETPCYDCILGNMAEDMDRDERVAGQADYSQPGTEQSNPEPGLSVDVGFVSLIQTRYALATLLPDERDGFERDACFWGNEADYIFSRPLQSRFATVSYRDDCRTCGDGARAGGDAADVIDHVEEVDEDPRS